MIRLKMGVVLLLALFASLSVSAADSDDVIKAFNTYWTSFSSGDYVTTAKLVHPDDLQALQTHLLPVFVKGLQAENPDVQQLAKAFFTGVPESKRASLTGAQGLTQLLNITALLGPELIEMLKQSKTEVVSVSFDEQNPKNAVVHYKVMVAGQTQTDSEQLGKLNNIWYLRTKERPEDTATKFKAALQQ